MGDQERILEDRIDDLTREIARTINDADVPGRPTLRAELRDYAISLLEATVVLPDPSTFERDANVGATASFNPLGMGIPMFFAGVLLIFLFPPVGMVLFVASAVMIIWGVSASLLSRK